MDVLRSWIGSNTTTLTAGVVALVGVTLYLVGRILTAPLQRRLDRIAAALEARRP
jgi:hypothetical protein